MKTKRFVTGIFVIMVTCPALAELSNGNGFIAADSNAETLSANCSGDTLTYNNAPKTSGIFTYQAQFIPNIYTVTLNKNSNKGGNTDSNPTQLFAKFADAVYRNSSNNDASGALSNPMSVSDNGLENLPTGATRTVTLQLNPQGGHSESEITNLPVGYNGTVSGQLSFDGFYENADPVNHGTKYIDNAGFITNDGIAVMITAPGGVEPSNQTWYARYDDAVVNLPNPQLTGYTFGGWKDNNSGDIVSAGNYTTRTNKELVAQWSVNKYTVKYICGNDILTDTNGATYDQPYAFWSGSSTCTNPGFEFSGWICVKTGTSTEINQIANSTNWTITTDVECTADWGANTLSFEWVDEDGTTVLSNTPASCVYNVTAGEEGGLNGITQPTKPGYTFTGWEITGWRAQ